MSDRILRGPRISPVGSVADALPSSIRSAIDDAYQRGLEEGWNRANGELAQHSAVLARKLAEADDRLVATVAAATARDAATLVDLAVELAEWFVGAAIVQDIDTLRSGIESLVEDIDSGRAHTLHLHPDVVAQLEASAEGATLPGIAAIEVDASLAPGELRLTSDGSTIERVWRHAVDRVRDAVLAEVRAAEDVGP